MASSREPRQPAAARCPQSAGSRSGPTMECTGCGHALPRSEQRTNNGELIGGCDASYSWRGIVADGERRRNDLPGSLGACAAIGNDGAADHGWSGRCRSPRDEGQGYRAARHGARLGCRTGWNRSNRGRIAIERESPGTNRWGGCADSPAREASLLPGRFSNRACKARQPACLSGRSRLGRRFRFSRRTPGSKKAIDRAGLSRTRREAWRRF